MHNDRFDTPQLIWDRLGYNNIRYYTGLVNIRKHKIGWDEIKDKIIMDILERLK